MTPRSVVALFSIIAAAAAGPLTADDNPQDKPAKEAAEAPERALNTTYRVRLNAHRQSAGKRVDSTPYVLAATEGASSALKVGTEMPVAVTQFTSVGEKTGVFSPATSFQYRNVGANIDCTVLRTNKIAPGTISVRLVLEHSSVAPGKPEDLKVPQFSVQYVKAEVVARLGQTYEVATMRLPQGDELIWDLTIEPLR